MDSSCLVGCGASQIVQAYEFLLFLSWYWSQDCKALSVRCPSGSHFCTSTLGSGIHGLVEVQEYPFTVRRWNPGANLFL